MTTTPGPTGLVVIDKEAGWTSHDVVAKVRSTYGQRRAGHAGTLDPDATGVLLVGLGRVTRLLRYLTRLGKEYRAEIVLGTSTDTLDSSGSITGEWDMSTVSLADVRAAAATLTGRILQVPPMVSAVKIGGRRLHELARKGIEVERPARTVEVSRFDIEPTAIPTVFSTVVECSSGTYVRSLAADLGAALGGGAHLRSLRRTRIGSFGVDEAQPVAELGPESLRSPAEALCDLERIGVDHELAEAVARGRPLDRTPLGARGGGPWAVVDETGRLLAVYETGPGSTMCPSVVLASR